ncbi:MAG: mechanosensitive ion channel family protein [Planctomycetota bacterium]|jgi:small-conductance mechanosensitive channel
MQLLGLIPCLAQAAPLPEQPVPPQVGPTPAAPGDAPPVPDLPGPADSWLLSVWGGQSPLVQTLIVVLLYLLANRILQRLVLRRIDRLAQRTENDLDDRLVHFFRKFSGIALFFLLLLLILGIWGIEVTPLLAGAGIVGISLGFAAKEFIADILAGIFLVTDRPMAHGDRVKVERIGGDWGSWGDVIDIGLRRTRIRNTDGVVVNYPNAVLSSSVITNFSHEPQPLRVRARFSVDLDADLPRAMEVATRAVEETEGVVSGSVEVVLRSIWDQERGLLLPGALLEARYRIEDVRERTRVRSRVLLAVVAALKEARIPLPSWGPAAPG